MNHLVSTCPHPSYYLLNLFANKITFLLSNFISSRRWYFLEQPIFHWKKWSPLGYQISILNHKSKLFQRTGVNFCHRTCIDSLEKEKGGRYFCFYESGPRFAQSLSFVWFVYLRGYVLISQFPFKRIEWFVCKYFWKKLNIIIYFTS